MSKKNPVPSVNFYQSNWQLKWVVLVVSVLISVGSIYYTSELVNQLKERERQQVHLYAKAIEYTANEEETFHNVNFIAQEILFQKKSTQYLTTSSQQLSRLSSKDSLTLTIQI